MVCRVIELLAYPDSFACAKGDREELYQEFPELEDEDTHILHHTQPVNKNYFILDEIMRKRACKNTIKEQWKPFSVTPK